MKPDVKKQFVIGLPGAGKTTFLAALWHVIDSEYLADALKLTHLDGDKKYLNNIRAKWADVLALDRTKLDDEHLVSMLLQNPHTLESTEVIIPDVSGESIESQWTDRVMPSKFSAIVSEAVGGMLFIHPRVHSESLITDANSLAKCIESDGETDADERGHQPELGDDLEPADDMEPWSAQHAPTQVQLVDLLQFLEVVSPIRPIRLAVIVSAWDLVRDFTPEKWLESKLPLLHQYMKSNTNLFEIEYFGISGQGGDLQKDLDKLQETTEPSTRIQVVRSNKPESHDITLPIRWVMNWE